MLELRSNIRWFTLQSFLPLCYSSKSSAKALVASVISHLLIIRVSCKWPRVLQRHTFPLWNLEVWSLIGYVSVWMICNGQRCHQNVYVYVYIFIYIYTYIYVCVYLYVCMYERVRKVASGMCFDENKFVNVLHWDSDRCLCFHVSSGHWREFWSNIVLKLSLQ
jgi:hypothetical protein